jgi:AraC family transcriptional regulator
MCYSLSATTGKPPSLRAPRLKDVVSAIPGIEIEQLLPMWASDSSSGGAVINCTLPASEMHSPALPELVILVSQDYQLTSALMDFGWGYREHFSSALHPIHVFPPETSFSWILDGPGRATLLTLDASRASELFAGMGVLNPLEGLWQLSQCGFTEHLVYTVVNALAAQLACGECPRLMMDSYCATVLYQLSTLWGATPISRKLEHKLPPHLLERTLAYINDRLAEDISLGDLAQLCEITKFHFLRCFKVSTGSSPYQYLLDRRVERAKRLLASTHYPVGDIAHMCGFSNVSGLGRTFRCTTGMTPGAWRQAHAKK